MRCLTITPHAGSYIGTCVFAHTPTHALAPAHDAQPFSIWRRQYALLLILALAAFPRFFELTTIPPPLHFDEAMNQRCHGNLETGHINVFYPQNGGREGLYINIETALIYLFGPEPWLLRLPAALFGTLTVWGVYLLVAEPFSVPNRGAHTLWKPSTLVPILNTCGAGWQGYPLGPADW
jgi:hypothetical protein